jgi:hypothetical protein
MTIKIGISIKQVKEDFGLYKKKNKEEKKNKNLSNQDLNPDL